MKRDLVAQRAIMSGTEPEVWYKVVIGYMAERLLR
jgi:hypothetical protein